MGNTSKKQLNAILRRTAQNLERANKQAVTCPNCKTRFEAWWNFCAKCGAHFSTPSTTDRPFACPPDEAK